MANLLIIKIPIIILLLPIVFQIIAGQISYKKNGKIRPWMISLTALMLSIFLSPIALFISFRGQALNDVKSMSPYVLFLAFLAFCSLIGVIIIQFLINRFLISKYKTNNKRFQ